MTDIVSLLPADYGYVPLAVVCSYFGLLKLGGDVMKARKAHAVEYPNMYATVVDVKGEKVSTAKSVDCAEKFNRAQRGHQNALENHYAIVTLTVLGGLVLPRASSAFLLLWTFGAMTYAKQYYNHGANNRNNGLALTKYLGALGLLGCNIFLSYSLFTR